MKTLICGRGAETGGRSVHVHLLQALRDMGHTVHGFDPLLHGATPGQRMKNLASLLVHTAPEVLVHVPSGADLDLNELQAVTAELEIMTIAMSTGMTFVDAPVARDRLEEFVATHDAVTTADPSQNATYTGPGAYAMFYMKPSCNLLAIDAATRRVRPVKSDVVVIGDADPTNAHLVRQLLEANLDIEIVGQGWGVHADLRLFASASGSLADRVARIRGSRLAVELPPTLRALSDASMSRSEVGLCVQALEAAAMGVPVLTAARPGVSSHLIPSAQVFTWESDSELSTLVGMLLSDGEALGDVALAGQQRVRSDHRALSRWVALFDDFTLEPQPLSSSFDSAEDHHLAVFVVANSETDSNDLMATLASITSQSDQVSELVLVASVEPHRQMGENVKVIVAPEADDDTLIALALSATHSGLVAAARPGDIWCEDRVSVQIEQLQKSPASDMSFGPALSGPLAQASAQSNLSLALIDSQSFLPASFMVRRSALSRLGSGRMLVGASDALIAATKQFTCSYVDQPLIVAGERSTAAADLCAVPISSLYPEICESTDRRSAAAAAFLDLAARVAASDSSLARELVGMALDCLDEPNLKLDALHSGAVWPDAVLIREQAVLFAEALTDKAHGAAPEGSDASSAHSGSDDAVGLIQR
jgi:Glycosyl transferases group 1